MGVLPLVTFMLLSVLVFLTGLDETDKKILNFISESVAAGVNVKQMGFSTLISLTSKFRNTCFKKCKLAEGVV